jgi:L-fuculose-phosphate aldolase
VFIHSEVLRARSDIQAVVHTHAPHAVAFSSLGKELVPVNNESGYFYKRLPIFSETSDLIVTPDRGKAVARTLGQFPALILRNHGIVTAGRSVEEAVWTALKLERACRVQLMAEWAGGPKLIAEGDDLEKKNSRGQRPDLYTNVFNYLVRTWCRDHGKPGDPCCSEHYETDLSGYKG